MEKKIIFDRYGSINDSRKEFLERLLPSLIDSLNLRTALDVGCGIGFFSSCLANMNLSVKAFDARVENIIEARERYPTIDFHVYDVEKSKVLELEPVDIVISFGLLYHLENPFQAIRNLFALTKKVVIIESMIAPHRLPVAMLVDEQHNKDQSIHYVAYVPSEMCLVKMLYKAGFSVVYKCVSLPKHGDFRELLRYRKRRTALVASKININLSALQKISEPSIANIWQKNWWKQTERILRFLKNHQRQKEI